MASAGFEEAIERIKEAKKKGATSLDLSSLELNEVPDILSQLKNLTKLYLSDNQLTIVPDLLGQLTNLKELDLHTNQLTVIPDWLGRLTNLTWLSLYTNQLTNVPNSLGELKNLSSLNLTDNQLTVVPDTLGQLKNLTELNLSINQLMVVPDSLGQLTKLTLLHLSSNQLTVVPDTLGQLKNLMSLGLFNNQLRVLPDTLRQLIKLKWFSLHTNQLTVIPDWVGQFSRLGLFSCRGNRLTFVPDALGQLKNLTELYLSDNQLTVIPDTLGQLKNLKRLYLQGNHLTVIPNTITKLKKLTHLFVHDNDALIIPDEVLGPSQDEVHKGQDPAPPQDILSFYFESLKGRQPLNEARLILVGHGDVGKTSIVHRLVHDEFVTQKKTEGINITKWPLNIKKEDILLNIWDFGGQEIMHSTHQFFLTHRSLYLLVLSGRAGHEDSDAEYWLQTIQSFGGSSPVIVVLNKFNEHSFDLNRGLLRQKYPFIKGFVETDCEDGRGFEQLRPLIEHETDVLPHLRDMFPTCWFEIKNELSNMEDNFISFEKFREICDELGEPHKNTQEALARYLHNLGVALNFRDDPRLRDTHVLSPRWVTKGIYTIINAKKLANQQGELCIDDLKDILDKENYPSEKYSFLFDLMQKFELSFSFHDGTGRFLIPELLGKDQPEAAEAFDPEVCLNFEYRYPIVPEGLLPRFIVRSHILSQEKARWKTGVILAFEGNEALISADMEAKKVIIRVQGPELGRRRLLAIIRSDFERIHSNFSFKPEERVPVPEHPTHSIAYKELLVYEKKGRPTYPLVLGEEFLDLNVADLLSGVDLVKNSRKPEERESGALKLFYSYAHEDEKSREELETHLKILQRRDLIAPWHDRKIMPGDEWNGEIDRNLEFADIILLLISADFIASDFCYNEEMNKALERHKKCEARVIPIIVRDINFKKAPFAKLQVLPKDAKAVDLWDNRDSAWRDVEEGIERVIEEMLTERKG